MHISSWLSSIFRRMSRCSAQPRILKRQRRAGVAFARVESLEDRSLLTINISGPITSDTTWSDTNETYLISGDVTVNSGVTLTIKSGVQVQTSYYQYEIYVLGTLNATGVLFSGPDTEIIVRNAGRMNLQAGTLVAGDQVKYEAGSSGSVVNSEFTSAKLRLESNSVTVGTNKFNRADPVYIVPSQVPQLYNNTFQNDATAYVYGTADSTATWHAYPNLTKFVIDGDTVVGAGVTLTIQSGLEVRTDYYQYELFVEGTLDATGVKFTGSDTEIIVRNGARMNLQGGSIVSGDQLKYEGGSSGTVANSEFKTAKLRMESNTVTINANKFNRVDPVYIIPSQVPQLYTCTFLIDATVAVYGVASSSATWHTYPNLSKYLIDGDTVVSSGVTLTIQTGIEVRTTYYQYEFYVEGTVDATGVNFTGSDTEIIVRNGARLNLQGNSTAAGDTVKYEAGSFGTISNSEFKTAKLRVESNFVTITTNKFNRVDPVSIVPSQVPQMYNNTFLVDATVFVYGTANSSATWHSYPNLTKYVIDGDMTVSGGVTLSLQAGIEVRTTYYQYEVYIDGTIDATGVRFTGTDTEIYVRNGARLNLQSGTSVDGDTVRYDAGSSGTISDSVFGSAKLRVESNSVLISNNEFNRGDPVYIVPSQVPQLYNNTFRVDAAAFVYGTANTDATWHTHPNLTRYVIDGDVVVNSGVTLALQSGLEVRTSYYQYEVYINGTVRASGVSFTGGDTEIYVNNGGRFDLLNGSSVTGDRVSYESGSLGDVSHTEFYSDLFINSVGSHQFTYNSFLAKTVRARGNANDTIELRNNYWGTTDPVQIEQRIEHKVDNAALPTILFNPYLSAAPPKLTITSTGGTNPEGNSGGTPFTFTITKNGAAGAVASVSYAVTGSGPAPANATDFGGSFPSGTVTFAGNETTKVITVNVVGDVLKESDEGFTVTLSNATDGATISVDTAFGTIQNDDTFSTYFVVNTNDNGPGSFRQAILDATLMPGRDLIRFGIGSGAQTISPASALPVITEEVVIDATTQPGFAGLPLIELNGANAGASNGLKITSGGTEVRGFVIRGFQQAGLLLANGGNNVIETNFIGTDLTGTVAHSNEFGILIHSSSSGNRIGTDGDGVNDAAEKNLISGNRMDGVRIQDNGSDSNGIAGNLIGTNLAGTGAIPNKYGIRIELGAKGNRVGTNGDGSGDVLERNLISGNSLSGISIANLGTDNNFVAGNYIGTDLSGMSSLGNIQHGITISDQAKGNRVGTNGNNVADVAERNVISGNVLDGIFITDLGTDTTRVAGNYIGIDAIGLNAIANNLGIRIENGAKSSVIGTDANGMGDAAERNVISGNRQDGIRISTLTTSSNIVAGNFIGTNAAGTTAIANQMNGVAIMSAGSNTVGGAAVAARNVISGSTLTGILISGVGATGNKVQGNFVGTNAAGAAAIPNHQSGVRIDNSATNNLIGGAATAMTNVVSGNEIAGIMIQTAGTSGNTIQGNLIGVGANGVTVLGNTAGTQLGWGIVVTDADHNTIGGIATGQGNLVANNAGSGIAIMGNSAVSNSIRGNRISSNGGLGIDLGTVGVAVNDTSDADTGPNQLQNFPEISRANGFGSSIQIQGSITGIANSQLLIDLYASDVADPTGFGEGRQYLGATTVTTNGSGVATFNITLPVSVTAGAWITSTATDSSNNTSEYSQAFRINSPPTDIGLSFNTLAEDQPSGTIVGTLTATDPDPGNTFTYAFATGAGDLDNGRFTIANGQLITATNLDFETKDSYSLRVSATDQGGVIFEKQLTITITNVNEGPTNISLSTTSIGENAPIGTTVGAFSTSDPDNGSTSSYQLISGLGDADNSVFSIFGNQLKSNLEFDFETRSSYSIRVQSMDQGGLSFEKQFTITIIDGNDAPTDLQLSSSFVPENQPSGSVVGLLSTTDGNPGDTFQYSLVTGAGDSDNALFTIAVGSLKTAASFNFETRTLYSIRVKSTDQAGLSFEKALLITVTNVNESPSDLSLSNQSILESQVVGSVVGSFGSTDVDVGNTFTYTLISGTGSSDNSAFSIVNGQLLVGTTLDFETKSIYQIRVRTSDQGGLTFDKPFMITVIDANEAPTNITLSTTSLNENRPVGTTVGLLSSSDPDAGNTFSYLLVPGAGSADNSSFELVGGQLRTASVFDFETRSSYSIRIQSTDQSGLSFEKAITINVTNLNEPPTDYSLSSTSIAEDSPVGTVVGNLTGIDPDAGASLNFSLVAGPGSSDNSDFTISNGQLLTAASLNFEAKENYFIRIRVTDQTGFSFEKAQLVTVTDANDAPTEMTLSMSSIEENRPIGTVVGSFGSVDPDAGDTFTYSLVTGTGSTDNSGFTLVNNQLLTAANFNFEGKSNLSIRIRTTDQGGQSFEVPFTIMVTNVNEAPTDSSLSANTIAESAASGTVIGTFTATDPDFGNTLTYSLVAGDGDVDNAQFAIVNGRLQSSASFDFESQSEYSIRVRASDQNSLSFEKQFPILVTDVNESPSISNINAQSISEDTDTGIVNFTIADPESSAGQLTVTATSSNQSLIPIANLNLSGAGSSRGIRIVPRGNQSGTSTITLTVGDGANFKTTSFLVTVNPVNDAPTLSTIGSQTIPEDTSSGPISLIIDDIDNAIGTLTVHASSSDTLLIPDENITISGSGTNRSLVFTPGANQDGVATITVTVSDGQLTSTQTFQVMVKAVDDAPTLTLSSQSLDYHVSSRATVSIDSGIALIDSDTINPQFSGAVLRVTGQAAKDTLSILKQDSLSVKRKTVLDGKTVIGTITGGKKGAGLIITFNTAANQGSVQKVLRNIGFKSVDKISGNRMIRIQLTNIGGADTNAATRQIQVAR